MRKKIVLLLSMVLFWVFGLGSCTMTGNGSKDSYQEYKEIDENQVATQSGIDGKNNLEVHFIDVGQGDSALVKCGGETMLIDAGENSKGTLIQHYLMNQEISSLKYIVGTHPDSDHIGGLDVMITKFDITSGEVWMPEIEKDTSTYRDVISAIRYKYYKKVCPAVGNTYYLGNALITILGPVDDSYDETNDYSIVLRIDYGTTSFLFTGDAEEQAEADLIENGGLEADVIKIGHHGSRNSTSQHFLDAVNPCFAVISVATENSYGHPTQEVLDRLDKKGVQVFRTDQQGSIVAISDGTSITWNCLSSNNNVSSLTCSYVLNKKSFVFHNPTCSSVGKMSESNRMDVSWSREECVEQGYTPCQNCNP